LPKGHLTQAERAKKTTRQPRHCSKCGDTAHDIRECPVWLAEKAKREADVKAGNTISHA
jgi:ribosomal protein S14